jgi:hypothetical protein
MRYSVAVGESLLVVLGSRRPASSIRRMAVRYSVAVDETGNKYPPGCKTLRWRYYAPFSPALGGGGHALLLAETLT